MTLGSLIKVLENDIIEKLDLVRKLTTYMLIYNIL